MKKFIKFLIASVLILPGFIFGGNVTVENVSNITTTCTPNETETKWYYLSSSTDSITRYPLDTFGAQGADVYITVNGGGRVGSSVQIWRHTYGSNKKVLTNCTNWNRPSTASPDGLTVTALENVDGCTFNKPTYTKYNNPGMVDAQIHYTVRYGIIWSYGTYTIPDKLYYTNSNINGVLCFPSGTSQSNGSNCPSNAGDYTKYYQEDTHVGECSNYKLFWCGDGLINSEIGTTYSNNVTYVEECDPNDPNHVGWNNNGKTCNPTTCKLENVVNQPQCSSTYNGTHYVNSPAYPNWLTENMNLCSVGTVVPNSLTHRWNGYGHVGHYGWSCTNSAGTTGCQANQQRCGDGIKNGSEACDPNDSSHAGRGNNGCSASCQPLNTHLTIQKELLTAGDLTAGSTVAYKITLTNDGTSTYYNAYILDIIPAAIQYLTSSIQNISNYQFTQGATGVNEYFVKYYNFNLNAGRSAVVYLTGKLRDGFMFEETTNCAFTSGDFDCELLPSSPKPYIKKYQKLGVDTNPNSAGWTTDILTVDLGDDISYRVDFGNVGNTGAYGMVKDILPECVEYHNAYLVDATGYGPIHYESTHTVQFSNIYLAPGQMAHMMVVGKIKQQDGCDGVFSYLNTGAFKFTFDSKWQNSTVLAVRDDTPGTTDVSITKDVDKYYVKKDDIVTYTITYTNGGSTTLTNYTIVDYWPSELDFMGVITPTSPVPSQNGNTITWVFENQNFVPGETREIKIKGRVR